MGGAHRFAPATPGSACDQPKIRVRSKKIFARSSAPALMLALRGSRPARRPASAQCRATAGGVLATQPIAPPRWLHITPVQTNAEPRSAAEPSPWRSACLTCARAFGDRPITSRETVARTVTTGSREETTCGRRSSGTLAATAMMFPRLSRPTRAVARPCRRTPAGRHRAIDGSRSPASTCPRATKRSPATCDAYRPDAAAAPSVDIASPRARSDMLMVPGGVASHRSDVAANAGAADSRSRRIARRIDRMTTNPYDLTTNPVYPSRIWRPRPVIDRLPPSSSSLPPSTATSGRPAERQTIL